jgi:hypothetical protein
MDIHVPFLTAEIVNEVRIPALEGVSVKGGGGL